jgi:hypothetical protein
MLNAIRRHWARAQAAEAKRHEVLATKTFHSTRKHQRKAASHRRWAERIAPKGQADRPECVSCSGPSLMSPDRGRS